MDELVGYYLTKITDKQWAERLLDGELFMRPLSAFGEFAKNDFRDDKLEGVAAVTGASGPGSSFVNDAFGESFPADGRVLWLSNYFLRYRIYSLYCFEYLSNAQSFIAPNERLVDFGDTVVIIVDAIKFFERLRRALSQRAIPLANCAARRVNYDMDSVTVRGYDEFTKGPHYSWQNEYRLSIDLESGRPDRKAWMYMSDLVKISFLGRGGEPDLVSFGIDEAKFDRAEWHSRDILERVRFLDNFCRDQPEPLLITRSPILLQLGCIRDICLSFRTIDLLSLKIPIDQFDCGPYILPPLFRAI
jgi:hypothetical protein